MKSSGQVLRHRILLCLVAVVVSGCSSIPKRTRTAVPEERVYDAEIPGITRARAWAYQPPSHIYHVLHAPQAEIERKFGGIMGKKHTYLALSGGGSNGAFGAGLLNGWTAKGTRPEFTMVSGISAGAILSPFAFLGSEYDHVIKDLFTKYDTEATLKKRNLLKAITRDAFSDSSPLRNVLSGFLGPEEVAKIAAEHRAGRRLMIVTTNIDLNAPVIWDLGRIANSGQPGARNLIIDLIMASAAIPVGLPPVFVDVEVDGEIYQEMHVDGGLCSQIFFYPPGVHWKEIEERLQPVGTTELYLVRNGFLYGRWREVQPTVKDLGSRAVSSLIRTQGRGDLQQMYFAAERDGLDFNLAYIPRSFKVESTEPFDLNYMNALYDLAYKSITEGDPWVKELD